MLTPIDEAAATASGATPQADKQISAKSTTNLAVVYTVPAGRKFVGWVSNEGSASGSSYTSWLSSGGTDVRHYSYFSAEPSSYKYFPAPEITLLAGTSVKQGSGSYNTNVWGVESDA